MELLGIFKYVIKYENFWLLNRFVYRFCMICKYEIVIDVVSFIVDVCGGCVVDSD